MDRNLPGWGACALAGSIDLGCLDRKFVCRVQYIPGAAAANFRLCCEIGASLGAEIAPDRQAACVDHNESTGGYRGGEAEEGQNGSKDREKEAVAQH